MRDGRGPDCNVWSNFKQVRVISLVCFFLSFRYLGFLHLLSVMQYGLPTPVALLRMDNNVPPWRSGLKEVMLSLSVLSLLSLAY